MAVSRPESAQGCNVSQAGRLRLPTSRDEDILKRIVHYIRIRPVYANSRAVALQAFAHGVGPGASVVVLEVFLPQDASFFRSA